MLLKFADNFLNLNSYESLFIGINADNSAAATAGNYYNLDATAAAFP